MHIMQTFIYYNKTEKKISNIRVLTISFCFNRCQMKLSFNAVVVLKFNLKFLIKCITGKNIFILFIYFTSLVLLQDMEVSFYLFK